MSVPLLFVRFSLRMPDRSPSAKAVSEASFLIASANVSVMFVAASVTVMPFSGLNDGGDGASGIVIAWHEVASASATVSPAGQFRPVPVHVSVAP